MSVSMPNTAKMIELPADLQAFAEERVRAGKSGSVDDVVRDALEQKKLPVLREALDVGIAELDAGLGVETTLDELMAEVSAELGLDDSNAADGASVPLSKSEAGYRRCPRVHPGSLGPFASACLP